MTVTQARPEAAPGYSHRQILLIMSGLMLGLLLASLDQTIVSTALTTISRDFHRLDLYSWVVTAYLLTSTASTPLYGKISDQFGRKRIFQVAIVIFLIGSALSGLSQNMYELIIFRGVQGVGAGGLMTLAMAIIGDVIAPRDRGRYQGYFGAVFGVSSVIGPLIGGFLVDQASWRWVFYVNLPIGAVALLVVNRFLHLDPVTRSSKVDILGALLIVGGVSLFLVGVQDAGSKAKLTTSSMAFGIVGILLIAAFGWWESKAPEPIIPLQLFKDRVFTVANVLGFVTGSVMFGSLIFLPLYFQTVRGVSPTMSGMRMLPMMVGMLSTSIISGRLISRIGRYKWFVVSGTAILAAAIGIMTTITTSTDAWALAGMLLMVGMGLGLFMQVLILAVQNSIPFEFMGTGTASVTFFRTLGGAIGAAVLGAVLILQEKTNGPHYVKLYGLVKGTGESFTHGMDQAFMYALPVAVLAFLLSFLMREVKLRSVPGVDNSDAMGIG
ncbi:MAG TPA: MDR family MFS transporter [Acidimicrobiales bacterium]|nr:MDR family MFS transporter [Acidimicrobiales bacterium]